ncbi:hypothetical protein Mapa_015015 [Marchantia paleacea]|nr:hypothetical protein Mapa_015015 [Marchantia paleacea]
MPLTSSAVDAFGVVTLVLVILLCLVGVFCVAYVLYFRSKIRKEQLVALRDFNSLWIVRIILIVFAILWGLGELLRLPLLRREGWLLHSLSFQWQANMCRAYILISLGFLEPCYFLTALFLVHGSLRNAPFTPRKSWNGKLRVYGLVLAVVFLLPVHVLFLGFSVLSRPSEPVFEAMGFMGFLTVLLCTTVGEGILVIRPIADALAVRWVFESAEKKRRHAIEEVSAEPLLVSLSSLSVFGTDRDDAALLARQSLLREAVGNVDRNSDPAMKEVSLVPMGNSRSYPERNGILISPPDSPALPGKPFVSHNLHSLV